ncbi:MAG: pyridoxine 5'-phosphate synthase [Bdellovibrionales bacterium]|nr:pyridoxine 5'-phosphate synthase [Bdellovibrionales bacterium]
MVRLSVNVNKVATLRNSRGGNEPCLIQVVEDLIQFGAWGITLHPRPDGRHILYQDVRDIAQCVQKFPSVELNIEGYPSENFLDLIEETRPHQCTLVPDPPSALTSDQGWDLEDQFSFLEKVLGFLKKNKVRSSVFIDPLCFNLSALQKLCPDRVEFYTGKWAKTFDHIRQKETPSLDNVKHRKSALSSIPSSSAQQSRLAPHYFAPAKAGIQKTVLQSETNGGIALNKECLKILETYKTASEQISKLGIGINAGHDLNQQNLKPLIERVPLVQEVSIGHALISEALYDGLKLTLEHYHRLLK